MANYDMPGVNAVREYIYDYVNKVDPDELDNVKREISDIEEEWENRCAHQEQLHL